MLSQSARTKHSSVAYRRQTGTCVESGVNAGVG